MIQHLIVIEGPTASGKTGCSIALAKHLNCSIISADSRQFYQEISIGTARPTNEEMGDIPHFLIGTHSVKDEINAARFASLVQEILEKKLSTESTAILVGGSGMFIDAFCLGLDDIPHDEALRNTLHNEWMNGGIEPLLRELEEKDPIFFKEVDQKNPVRIIRALVAIRLTGKTFSSLRIGQPKTHPFQVHRFVLSHERESLYRRINLRVEQMMEQGLLEEVRSVLPYRQLTPLQTVGYAELFSYLDGECTLQEAVQRIQQNSRRYAKRQLTWFRRHEDAHWIPYTTEDEVVKEICQQLPW